MMPPTKEIKETHDSIRAIMDEVNAKRRQRDEIHAEILMTMAEVDTDRKTLVLTRRVKDTHFAISAVMRELKIKKDKAIKDTHDDIRSIMDEINEERRRREDTHKVIEEAMTQIEQERSEIHDSKLIRKHYFQG